MRPAQCSGAKTESHSCRSHWRHACMGADRDAIAAAARVLADGGLAAFPTETVYGLGADATNGEAVARLYAAKGRPRFNPLIAHVTSAACGVRVCAIFVSRQEARAKPSGRDRSRWCCPSWRAARCLSLATAGLDSIAVRVPGASGRARFAENLRQAGGRAFGQSVGSRLADDRRTRARRSRWPRRSHSRRRRDQCRHRVHHRVVP